MSQITPLSILTLVRTWREESPPMVFFVYHYCLSSYMGHMDTCDELARNALAQTNAMH